MKLFSQKATNEEIVAEVGDVKDNNFLSLSLDRIEKIKTFDDCKIVKVERSLKSGQWSNEYKISEVFVEDAAGNKFRLTGTIRYAFTNGLRSKFERIEKWPWDEAAERDARDAVRIAATEAERAAKAAAMTPEEKEAKAAVDAAWAAKKAEMEAELNRKWREGMASRG